ncbi:MAG: N-acetylmuramoyl-L-alanine amidase [Methanofastidiosum sp.]
MEIIKYNSPNYWSSRYGQKIIAICWHVSGGTWESNHSWIMNPIAKASYHYYVKKDGTIIQYVEDKYGAHANGLVQSPTWKHIKSGVNPNWQTIAISREGHNHEVPTDAQWKSLVWIGKKKSDEYGIPYTKEFQIGHCEIDSVDRWYCPGSGFSFDKLLKDLNNTNIIQPENPSLNYHIVVSGDTLSRIAVIYGYTWQELASYNNILSPYLIFPGDKIYLPLKKTNDKEIEQLKEQIKILQEQNKRKDDALKIIKETVKNY